MFYNARWYDPCIMQFNQPDTLIPDSYNTLDWNRYSYARYNPLHFTDPSGHRPCDGEFGCQRQTNPNNIFQSIIRIGFGSLNEDGDPEGKGGLGTVVDDRRTIITAAHVYAEGQYMFYRLGEHGEELHMIDMDDLTLEFSEGGDLLTITLPEDLPDDFVRAISDPDHTFLPLQDVSVAYQDENRNLDVLETELTLIPYTLRDDWTLNYVAKNPGAILNSGDSGGGVFYDGKFVGVNSAIFPQFGRSFLAFQGYP